MEDPLSHGIKYKPKVNQSDLTWVKFLCEVTETTPGSLLTEQILRDGAHIVLIEILPPQILQFHAGVSSKTPLFMSYGQPRFMWDILRVPNSNA
jgi:hypothetical protein